jgi:hypothetical protein
LRIHCDIQHHREYVAVEEWLGKTVKVRLQSLEQVAKEGLVGHQEIRYLDQ